MKFNSITPDFINKLKQISGNKHVSCEKEMLEKNSRDETEDLSYLPEVVVNPATVLEISEIITLCNNEKIPVTPRGGGTGLSGGALPVFGGVLLNTNRLNKILEIDERNLQVTVEPGVVTQTLQEKVIERGFFYPPDPASKGSCFIGGNIAENSGGPKAVKYGVVKDYVLNLEVVLPSGEIIWTGANVLKNATGYNLTQLFVGSEGTLGVVTKIVLRLIPYPSHNLLMLVPFKSSIKACESVSAIFKEGITPSGLEFMERDAIERSLNYQSSASVNIEQDAEAILLVEVDGNDMDALIVDCEKISKVVDNFDCGEILFADNKKQKDELMKVRTLAGEAVKATSIYKEEDTVVPRAELPLLLKGVKDIGKEFGFKSVCYGHAGDGNLHINIIKAGMSDDEWENKLENGIRAIFQLCVKLGGTISGEHGIGFVQKKYMDVPFNDNHIRLMQGIKKLIDPIGIMNPGKIFE